MEASSGHVQTNHPLENDWIWWKNVHQNGREVSKVDEWVQREKNNIKSQKHTVTGMDENETSFSLLSTKKYYWSDSLWHTFNWKLEKEQDKQRTLLAEHKHVRRMAVCLCEYKLQSACVHVTMPVHTHVSRRRRFTI